MPTRQSTFVVAVFLAAAALPLPAFAQTSASQWDCTGAPNIAWEIQVGGCTAAIVSGRYAGKNLSWAYNNRGNAYSAKGQYVRAIEDYDEAIRLNPDNANAFTGRGIAQKNNGQLDRAMEDYNQAIKLDPNHANAFNGRGNIHYLKREYGRAIEDYDQAIKLNPNHANAHYARGLARELKGDLPGAVSDLETFSRLSPSDPNGTRVLRRVREALLKSEGLKAGSTPGQTPAQQWKCTGNPDIPWDTQIEGCAAAIASGQFTGKNLSWIYGNRGSVHRAKGQFDSAFEDYNEAIRLNPDNAFAFNNRGVAYKEKGQLDRAIEDHSYAIKLNPNFSGV